MAVYLDRSHEIWNWSLRWPCGLAMDAVRFNAARNAIEATDNHVLIRVPCAERSAAFDVPARGQTPAHDVLLSREFLRAMAQTFGDETGATGGYPARLTVTEHATFLTGMVNGQPHEIAERTPHGDFPDIDRALMQPGTWRVADEIARVRIGVDIARLKQLSRRAIHRHAGDTAPLIAFRLTGSGMHVALDFAVPEAPLKARAGGNAHSQPMRGRFAQAPPSAVSGVWPLPANPVPALVALDAWFLHQLASYAARVSAYHEMMWELSAGMDGELALGVRFDIPVPHSPNPCEGVLMGVDAARVEWNPRDASIRVRPAVA